MRIAYENYIDTANSLVALTEETYYPASNVAEQRLSMEYHSTGASTQTVTINLGSAKAVNTAAILGHNFTSSATVVVAANTSDSWGSPATSQTLIFNAETILKFFADATYQYWQFQISDPTNTDGYLSIGRLWLGSYITIDPSSLLDFVITKQRSDVVIHGKNRQKFASEGIGWRKFELSFPPSNTTMINLILAFIDFVGNHSSFIFCNFDSIRDYTIVEPCYCSLVDLVSFSHTEAMKFNYSLVLEEEK